MAMVTLRVLDGAGRGRVYENLPTPVTIGREEGNSVQLNDERISRFHLKIQEDDGKLVLTDLESTNGTRVNGEHVQLWLLRAGDIVTLGRTVLLVGSRDEIAQRLASLRTMDLSAGAPMETDELNPSSPVVSLEFELQFGDDSAAQATLHTIVPPEMPVGLSPGQAAQLCELLHYLHVRIRRLVQTVEADAVSERVTLDERRWQDLLDLYDHIASYLRSIGSPEDSF